MDSKYVDDLIDEDEIPELTKDDFAKMVPSPSCRLACSTNYGRFSAGM